MATGKGKGGGGGAGIDQGTQTVPVEEFFESANVVGQAKNIVNAAWSNMDDADRRFVIEAYRGSTVRIQTSPNAPNGRAEFLVGQNRITKQYESAKPTGKINLHQRLVKGDQSGGVRAASTLIHEGRHFGGGKNFSMQETAATGRSLRYHEKEFSRAMSRGDVNKAAIHLTVAQHQVQYRGNIIGASGRNQDPLLTRYSTKGFGGNKEAGRALSGESSRPIMTYNTRLNYRTKENRAVRFEQGRKWE